MCWVWGNINYILYYYLRVSQRVTGMHCCTEQAKLSTERIVNIIKNVLYAKSTNLCEHLQASS